MPNTTKNSNQILENLQQRCSEVIAICQANKIDLTTLDSISYFKEPDLQLAKQMYYAYYADYIQRLIPCIPQAIDNENLTNRIEILLNRNWDNISFEDLKSWCPTNMYINEMDIPELVGHLRVQGTHWSYGDIKGVVYHMLDIYDKQQKHIFWHCEKDTEGPFVIEDGTIAIDDYAFYSCKKITSISIPSSVKKIGKSAFSNCEGLKTIVIPEGTETIESDAFNDCKNLKTVSISSTVTFIGCNAFSGCTKLSKIEVDSNNKNYSVIDGILYENRNVVHTCPLAAKHKQVIVPDGVIGICSGAFKQNKTLESIKLPESLKKIGAYSFDRCKKLSDLVIPSSVTQIQKGAFAGCESLQAITIPNMVSEIPDDVFQDCKRLEQIVLSDNVEKLGNSAFENCRKLTNIDLPSSILEINDCCFRECIRLKEISIPNKVFSINFATFADCVNLKQVNIPEGVFSIESNSFRECNKLIEINLPDSIERIERNAFVSIPLKSIHIPSNICEIEDDAFEYLPFLSKIDFVDNDNYYLIDNMLVSRETGAAVLVASRSIVQTSYRIPDGIHALPSYAFLGCDNLKEIDLNEVNKLGYGIFHSCIGLTNVVIPDSVKELPEGTFIWCESLTTVTLPDLDDVCADAFGNCTSLQEIRVPYGTKEKFAAMEGIKGLEDKLVEY